MADLTAINQVIFRGKDETGAAAQSVIGNFVKIDAAASSLIDRFGGLNKILAATGLGLSVGWATGLIEGAIAGQAELGRLAAATGATVESLSAMRTAAKYAQTDMDSVAHGLEVFAKNIVAAQAGTGKQAEALKALGFNAQTFATQFKTTDQAILAVAKALDQYGDGIGKTAILQNLLGRSGAQLSAFMRELAERGLDSVKVTAAQAQAAKELEDSITKLKSSFANMVNALAAQLVPILQKVVDGMGTFKAIALAALAAFVVWPTAVAAVSAALVSYREAALAAALANEVLGASTTAFGVSWAATIASAQAQFLTLAGLLRTIPALLFAAFAGWELGKWLSEQFVEAKNFGYAFVDSMLTGWEYIKYGAGVAWEAIKFAFAQAIENMRQSFGGFIGLMAEGLSHVPFASAFADQLRAFADSVGGQSGAALATFRANVAALGKEFDTNRAKIHDITTDLMAMAIAADAGSAASARANKGPPPVPAAAKEALVDLTKALDAYQKALAALAKAYTDSIARSQLQAITDAENDIKRQYDRGVIDFKQYWDAKTALQKTALGVQEQQIQDDIATQEKLVASIQTNINAIDPTKFKTQAEYISVVVKASKDLIEAQTGLVKLQGDLNVVQQKGAQVGKDYVEQLIQANSHILKSNLALQQEIDQQRLANETMGMSAAQIQLVIAAKDQALLQDAMEHGASQKTIDDLKKQIELRGQLAGELAKGEGIQHALDAVRELDSTAKDVFNSIFDKGTDTFKKIGDAIKKWVIDLLYQLTLRPFIINIAASLTGISQGALANTLGAGNSPLSLLTGGANLAQGGGAGGGVLSGLNNLPTSLLGLPSFTTAIENLGTIIPTFSAAMESGAGIIGSASAAFAGTAASFATLALPLIPVLGLALGSLFSKKPSEVRGQFGVSTGTTGFEDNAFTPSAVGNLGFLDANTQQFSGEAAQVFNKIVAGALDAFQQRYSPEQTARLASILQNTTFATESGTFNTQDFLQKYGGAVLQQVVTAAFNVLDPALGAVAAAFRGTADEVAKFGNTLLAVYDATKAIGNADFASKVESALGDATQATADKILALVTIVQQFGESITGLGPKIEALDPAAMTAFIDALGGAQAAVQTMTYISANFTTSADKASAAQALLTSDFANLGLAVPTTHQAFLALLNSFLDGTDAGNKMYAAVAALAPLFVQVAGTADQAAQALAQQVKSAEDFFKQNFFTDAERQAAKLAADTQQLDAAQTALGISIPRTIDGFRTLVLGIDRNTDAGNALYQALIVLAPAVFDLGNAARTAASQINDAIKQITVGVSQLIKAGEDAATQFLSTVNGLANSSPGDFGTKLGLQITLIGDALKQAGAIQGLDGSFKLLGGTQADKAYVATLAQSYQQFSDELARFTMLSAQYDAARAEQLVQLQDWYAAQKAILDRAFQGHPDVAAPDALSTIFQQKWDAIVNGAKTAAASLDDFIKSIQQIANNSGGNAGQKAQLELALSDAKLTQLQVQYAAALPGSALATSLSADITKLQAYNAGLATQIAHFTTYNAQYGTAVANQLVDLENQFETWKAAVGDNADALAIVTDIFNSRFADIVNGIKAGVDQLAGVKQQIADYLKGLQIGELSPLTPQEQFAQAKQAFESEYALAAGGNAKALGDITQFADAYLKEARDFYASGENYTGTFQTVTAMLGQLAGTTPQGGELDFGTALVNALPANGQLASSTDLNALAAKLIEAIAALAKSNSGDSEAATAELKAALVAIEEEITAR